MHMRINEPREHVFTGRVNDLRPRRRRKVAGDPGDGFIFAIDVRMITGIGGDDFTVFN